MVSVGIFATFFSMFGEVLFWTTLWTLNWYIGGYFWPKLEYPDPLLTGEFAQYSCYAQRMRDDGDNFVNAAMFLSQGD